MRKIPVGSHLFAVVDDEDFESLVGFNWFPYGRPGGTTYACRNNPKGKPCKIVMHRQILGLSDPRIGTDHIDGDGLNNQRSNLRIATCSGNNQNVGMKANNASGFKGVHWDTANERWKAKISANRKVICLGYFKNIMDAVRAYDQAALEMHGEFAKTNKMLGLYHLDSRTGKEHG